MSASPFILLPVHFHNDDATLLSSGTLTYYVSGSGDTVLAPVYTDHTGLTAGPNPVVLNLRGEPPTEGIYLNDAVVYKVILKRANGTTIKSIDGYRPKFNGSDGTDGLNGTRGSLWYSAPNNPASTSGCITEDRFQNTVTGDVFRFNGVSWAFDCNIKGANGTDGTNGTSNAFQIKQTDEGIVEDTFSAHNYDGYLIGWHSAPSLNSGDWNNATGKFISSISSKYLITVAMYVIHDPQIDTHSHMEFHVNGVSIGYIKEYPRNGITPESTTLSGSVIADIEVGDVIQIYSSRTGCYYNISNLGIASIGGVKGDKGDTGSFTASYPMQLSEDEVPNLTISPATTLLPGYMSASDKTKLNAITGTNTGDETESSIRTKLDIPKVLFPWLPASDPTDKWFPFATITIDAQTGTVQHDALAEFKFIFRGTGIAVSGTIEFATSDGGYFLLVKDVNDLTYPLELTTNVTQFVNIKKISDTVYTLYISNNPHASYNNMLDLDIQVKTASRCSIALPSTSAWSATDPGGLVLGYVVNRYTINDSTISTKLSLSKSNTTRAGFNLGAYGASPSSTVDGDVYKSSSSVLNIVMTAVARTFAFLESAQTWVATQIFSSNITVQSTSTSTASYVRFGGGANTNGDIGKLDSTDDLRVRSTSSNVIVGTNVPGQSVYLQTNNVNRLIATDTYISSNAIPFTSLNYLSPAYTITMTSNSGAWNLSLGGKASAGNITGNATVTISNPLVGMTDVLYFSQNASVAYSMTISMSGVTFYLTRSTIFSSNSITIPSTSIPTLGAWNRIELYWLATTACFVTIG